MATGSRKGGLSPMDCIVDEPEPFRQQFLDKFAYL